MNKIIRSFVILSLFFTVLPSLSMQEMQTDKSASRADFYGFFKGFKDCKTYTDIVIVSSEDIDVYCGREFGFTSFFENKLITLLQYLIKKIKLDEFAEKAKDGVDKLTGSELLNFKMDEQILQDGAKKYIGEGFAKFLMDNIYKDPMLFKNLLYYVVQKKKIMRQDCNFTKMRFYHGFHKVIAFKGNCFTSRWNYLKNVDLENMLKAEPKLIVIKVNKIKSGPLGAIRKMLFDVSPYIYATRGKDFDLLNIRNEDGLRKLLKSPKRIKNKRKSIEKKMKKISKSMSELIAKCSALENSVCEFNLDSRIFGLFEFSTTIVEINDVKKTTKNFAGFIKGVGDKLENIEERAKDDKKPIVCLSGGARKFHKLKVFIKSLVIEKGNLEQEMKEKQGSIKTIGETIEKVKKEIKTGLQLTQDETQDYGFIGDVTEEEKENYKKRLLEEINVLGEKDKKVKEEITFLEREIRDKDRLIDTFQQDCLETSQENITTYSQEIQAIGPDMLEILYGDEFSRALKNEELRLDLSDDLQEK